MVASAIAAALAATERVEGIFHDIVTGRADDMDEELAGEGPQLEAGADVAAVEDDAGSSRSDRLAPFREAAPVAVEQDELQRDLAGAVARPVIRRDESRVEAVGVAEEGEIGREVERIEIEAAIGQKIVRQPHRIEADDLGRLRHEMAHMVDEFRGIEGGDQHEIGVGASQIGHRLGAAAEARTADQCDVLHEDAARREARETVDRIEPAREAERIIDREAARGGESFEQGNRPARCQRVRHGLVKTVAAPAVVEGFNSELHLPCRVAARTSSILYRQSAVQCVYRGLRQIERPIQAIARAKPRATTLQRQSYGDKPIATGRHARYSPPRHGRLRHERVFRHRQRDAALPAYRRLHPARRHAAAAACGSPATRSTSIPTRRSTGCGRALPPSATSRSRRSSPG